MSNQWTMTEIEDKYKSKYPIFMWNPNDGTPKPTWVDHILKYCHGEIWETDGIYYSREHTVKTTYFKSTKDNGVIVFSPTDIWPSFCRIKIMSLYDFNMDYDKVNKITLSGVKE
jgi:hypothetical protein